MTRSSKPRFSEHSPPLSELAQRASDDGRARMREIYKKLNHLPNGHNLVLEAVAKEFGWTIGQAYIATEFLYRPENFN